MEAAPAAPVATPELEMTGPWNESLYGNQYQRGGLVRGAGDEDRTLISATPREFVMSRAATQHYGEGFFDSLNRMLVPSGKASEKNMNIEVVLLPSEDFLDQVILRGKDTIIGIIEKNAKRIRKTLGVE
jgi:hypothetical protein